MKNPCLPVQEMRGSIPVLGRSPGEGNGKPLQYSCLENPMDRGAWWLQSTGSQESDATEQQHLLCAKKPPDTKKTWAKIHHTADCGHPGGTLVRGGHAALGRPLRGGHLDVVVRSMWDLSSWKTDDSPFSAPTD